MEKTGIETTEGNNMAATHHEPSEPFFATVAKHYAARSDPVSAHLLARLCRDYQTNQLSDMHFYIGVYQHLYSTDSLRLLAGFKSLLLPGWKDLELGSLNRQIEVEVEEKKEKSRKAVGEVADGLMAMNESGGALATIPSGDHGADAAIVATGNKQKKKTPMKGFKSSYATSKETPSALAPEERKSQDPMVATSDTPTPLEPNVRKSLAQPKIQMPNSPHSKPSTPKEKAKPQAKPTPNKPALQKPSPSPSSTTENKTGSNLPTASSIPHLGPIYPTIRAILSRLSTKPYIHALCGQHFGHPAEVKRHHDGQSGRPGCWEKSGKPKNKAWDEDKSCKITMKDLEYSRVQEGWVVTSWGDVNVEGVREGEDEGLVGGDEDDGETEGLSGGTGGRGGGGKKRKMPAPKPKEKKTSKPQAKQEEQESGADSSDAESDEDESDDEDDSFSDAELTPEPAAKRRNVVATENEEESPDVNTAARAAALGLRARK